MTHRWLWRARVVRVIDGDTLDLEIDCGFHTVRTERVRLLGVNAPEMKGETRAAGELARAEAMLWCDQLDRWLELFPTAPPDAVAAWLHGDKGSMRYYERADELATVTELRGSA